jgi:integrase
MIRNIRQKTGVPRIVPLWPETVAALREVMAKRPADTLVFRTKYGEPWVRTKMRDNKVIGLDAVAGEFRKIAGPGVGFYALRHTFSTFASELPDVDSKRRIMGHKLRGMDDVYVDHISLERLRTVANHVRSRLLKPKPIGFDLLFCPWVRRLADSLIFFDG